MTPDFNLAVVVASIFCTLGVLVVRIGRMHFGVTSHRVFLQHIVLAACLALALIMPPKHMILPVVVGVQIFLGLGSKRWRRGTPMDEEVKERP